MSAADQSTIRFRPSARNRKRIAAGVALGAVALAGNLAAYAAIDDRVPVLQITDNVPAGTQITPEMVRVVEVSSDPTFHTVSADQLPAVVGQHATVRLVAGALLTPVHMQPDPLMTPGRAVVAVQVEAGAVPRGVYEQVVVQLVVPGGNTIDGTVRPSQVVTGTVVGAPIDTEDGRSRRSISVELEREDAALIAAADDIRIVLLGPEDTGS